AAEGLWLHAASPVAQATDPTSAAEAASRLFAIYRELEANPMTGHPRLRLAFPSSSRRAVESAVAQIGAGTDFAESIEYAERGPDAADLVAHLHNKLAHPRAAVWWHDTAMRLFAGRGSLSRLASILSGAHDEVSGLRHPRTSERSAMRLWSSADRVPDRVERGEVVVARPDASPDDLRNGMFAPRAAVLERALKSVPRWRERASEGDLSVMWLGGEHGSGKSVLLLTLLAHLYATGIGPVAWLGKRVDGLPQALKWFAELPGERGPGVIAIDDPYLAQPGAGADAPWLAAREHGGRLPLVVCSGPPSQYRRFVEDLGDLVTVTHVEVPPCDSDEIEQLAQWFELRTEHRPEHEGMESELPFLLLLQWWESAHNTVIDSDHARPFVDRFRRIVRHHEQRCGQPLAIGLEELISRMAAMSRYEVGYQNDVVSLLLDEKRLKLLPDLYMRCEPDGQSESGTWRMHPRLARMIFDGWYPPERFAKDRARTIRECVDDLRGWSTEPAQRNAPLWTLARIAAEDDGLEHDGLTGELTAIYQKVLPEAVRVGTEHWECSDLPVWIELAARCPQVEFLPHPVDLAARALAESDRTSTGYRLTCHKLLQWARAVPAEQERAREPVIDALIRDQSWPGWGHVAQESLRIPGVSPRLLSTVEDYLTSRPLPPGELALGLVHATPDAELADRRDRLAKVLPQMPGNAGWAKFVSWLVRNARRHDDSLRAALAWVERHRASPFAGMPLGLLLRLAHGQPMELKQEPVPAPAWLAAKSRTIDQWARDWITDWCTAPWANYVLEGLVTQESPHVSARLWNDCLRWIDSDRGDPSMLFELVVNNKLADHPLCERLWSWLESGPPLQSAGKVWELLWKRGGDERLLRLARSFLRSFLHADTGWSHIWSQVWAVKELRDEELAAFATTWTELHLSAPSWSYVWEPLIMEHPTPELVELGLRHLESTPSARPGWIGIWHQARRQLRRTGRDKEAESRLFALADRYLDGERGGGAEWSGIRIWAERAQGAPLNWPYFQLGMDWLTEVRSRDLVAYPSLPSVWLRLSHAYRRQKLPGWFADAGLHVLGQMQPSSRLWPKVVQQVRHLAGDKALDSVLTALAREPASTDLLPLVVKQFGDVTPVPRPLVTRIVDWLEAAADRDNSWKQLWLIANQHAGEDLSARVQALSGIDGPAPVQQKHEIDYWLTVWEQSADKDGLVNQFEADAEQTRLNAGTVRIWRTCLEHRPGSEALMDLGRSWLAAPPPHPSGGELWADVWLEIQRHHPDDLSPAMALGNLITSQEIDDEQVMLIVRKILRREEELGGRVRRSLSGQLLHMPPDSSRWLSLWEAVWLPQDTRLGEIAKRQIMAGGDDPRLASAWRHLWRSAQPPDLAEVGVELLRARTPADRAWLGLWLALREAPEPVPGLDEVVRAQLDGADAVSREDVALWQAAVLANPADDVLGRYAALWFTHHVEEDGWSDIWPRVWQARPGDPGLREAAVAWLRSHPTSNALLRIALAVLGHAPDPEITRLVLDRVTAEHSPDSYDTLIALLDCGPTPETTAAAETWLVNELARPRPALRNYGDLWLRCEPNDRLNLLGLRWLGRVFAMPGWRLDRWIPIWSRLWDAEVDRPRLLELYTAQDGRRLAGNREWADQVQRRLLRSGQLLGRKPRRGR
ncbi:hypothetical protein, partial [Nonomuraea rhizosphaerae]|uniref:hypothetical protein n=1 Tax=Nonomuraea rhizosphaerae TaxID=2665663 RepID=UPI001C5E06ED